MQAQPLRRSGCSRATTARTPPGAFESCTGHTCSDASRHARLLTCIAQLSMIWGPPSAPCMLKDRPVAGWLAGWLAAGAPQPPHLPPVAEVAR